LLILLIMILISASYPAVDIASRAIVDARVES